jgi:hypothetical protein
VKDPLAGRRQEINEGTAYSLMWVDEGQKCPVELGDIFQLRSCRIEITKIHRIQKGRGDWWWRAEFARYVPPTPEFLDRRGGLTENIDAAMPAQDDPEPGTLRAISNDERDPTAAAKHAALGDQPEPEAVPKDEIPNYSGSRTARQCYEREMAERRIAEATAPLEERLVRLREQARHRNIDISSDLRVIEKRIAAAEDKVLERAAA